MCISICLFVLLFIIWARHLTDWNHIQLVCDEFFNFCSLIYDVWYTYACTRFSSYNFYVQRFLCKSNFSLINIWTNSILSLLAGEKRFDCALRHIFQSLDLLRINKSFHAPFKIHIVNIHRKRILTLLSVLDVYILTTFIHQSIFAFYIPFTFVERCMERGMNSFRILWIILKKRSKSVIRFPKVMVFKTEIT